MKTINTLFEMRLTCHAFFLIMISILFTNTISAHEIDKERKAELLRHALEVPDTLYQDTPEITEYLETFASNERELLMLFYYWIANNIDYDTEKHESDCDIYTSVFHTLETGLTMCQGYAELFCDFCDWVDITCEVINGYAKGYGYGNDYMEIPNHLWNAVYIDDKWELFDLTWASGYTEHRFRRLRYVRLLREHFVFTDPEILILTHFPVNKKWQLLEKPITKKEFFSPGHNRKRVAHEQELNR